MSEQSKILLDTLKEWVANFDSRVSTAALTVEYAKEFALAFRELGIVFTNAMIRNAIIPSLK